MPISTRSYFDASRGITKRRGNLESKLLPQYHAITKGEQLVSTTQHQKLRLLGKGGQGLVYLSERNGTDHFKLPVALKVFSPEPYRDDDSYRMDMGRVAAIASRVALIHHNNVVDVQNFIEQNGIRLMEMERVDGFDLRDLLMPPIMESTQAHVAADRWDYINRVIITKGSVQSRLKPGMAIQVVRECLAGLGALHRHGIIHRDIKPSNIMLKRSGNVKIIDIGSASDVMDASTHGNWSPGYAAPEILQGRPGSPQADLASLGYVLVEMLAGKSPFEGIDTYDRLLEAKLSLEKDLPGLMPEEVRRNELLMHLCRRLITPNLARRFPSALAADSDNGGAADFHRQLVKGDLATEYETDFRVWLEQVQRQME